MNRFGPFTETVIIHSVVFIVETIKQTSIQEWNSFIGKLNKQIGIFEQILITHQFVIIISRASIFKLAFRNFIATFFRDRAVEHGEEKILKNGAVIVACIRFSEEGVFLMGLES